MQQATQAGEEATQAIADEVVAGGDIFVSSFSLGVFTVLFAGYLVQAALAFGRARKNQRVDGPDGKGHEITLWEVVRTHDGGLANVWTFFILAIFSPVLLTGLGNILPLVGEEDPIDRVSAALYFICLASIGVIITLELSYVQLLKRSARDWIPLLVVGIALDVITLVVFFGFVKNPHDWTGALPTGTRVAMTVATLAALLSSFLYPCICSVCRRFG